MLIHTLKKVDERMQKLVNQQPRLLAILYAVSGAHLFRGTMQGGEDTMP